MKMSKMSDNNFIKTMVGKCSKVSATADVFALKRYSLEDIEQRVKPLVMSAARSLNLPFERGDWVTQKDRTLIRLPLGARAVVYHASGAMQLVTGLEPMESLFPEMLEKETLVKMVEETATKLNINQFVNQKEPLQFEHLWQIKAAAATRTGESVKPVLCRAIGAYRHYLDRYPVLGPASVAIKIAGDGKLDSLSINIRETTGELVARVKTISPEQAAGNILNQMSSLWRNSKVAASEVNVPEWFRFGYLGFPKRKAQVFLAPVYLAAVRTEGEESQSYLFATPASEETYLPLQLDGHQSPATPFRGNDSKEPPPLDYKSGQMIRNITKSVTRAKIDRTLSQDQKNRH